MHAEETTVVRTAAHITGLIVEARLPDRVRDLALATFDGLAEAEGKLHRRPPSQVHFHEVGSLDAIIDIVGTCAALYVLGVEQVHASSVATGTGMHRAAHGLLPSPAPAVIELLRGAPSHGIDVPFETTTPTGAALLAATVVGWGGLPPMVVRASGFGAGTRELDDRPNVTQVVLGDPVEGRRLGSARRPAGDQRRRRHRRDRGRRRRRPVGRRRPRRLGDQHPHEEGPARPSGERTGRPVPGPPGDRRHDHVDRQPRGAGDDPRTLAPGQGA